MMMNAKRKSPKPAVSTFPLLLLLGLATLTSCSSGGNEIVALLRVNSEGTTEQFRVYKETQAALIKSPYVLNAALRELNQQSGATDQVDQIFKDTKPLKWLTSHLEIEYPGDSEILRVGLHSSEANQPASIQIVNAVIDAYQDEVAATERNQRAELLEILRMQFRQNERDISELSDACHKLASQIGSADSVQANVERDLVNSELAKISTRVATMEEKEVWADVELRSLAAKLRKDKSDGGDEAQDLGVEYNDLERRHGAIQEVLEEQLALQSATERKLKDLSGFSSDLETKKSDLARMRRQTTELADRIAEVELSLRFPARVQIVQRAIHVD